MRYALISAMVTFGLLVGSAASGTAAAGTGHRAPVTFGVSGSSASSLPAPAQPCRTGTDSCASSDPDLTLAWSSSVSTAGCKFRLTVDWGDGSPVRTVNLTGKEGATVWPVGHAYRGGVSARQAYQIRADAAVTSDAQGRGCSIETAALTFTLMCTDRQLSGAAWNARFPGGDRDVEHLNGTFRPKVQAFMAALEQAGISVDPQSTMRSPQRSYLMHYSYLISKKQIAPQDVPAYVPIGDEKAPRVCWVHRTASGAVSKKASVTAAAGLLRALGVDSSLRTAPALHSRHNTGDAIDMKVSWSTATVKIKDARGKSVRIASGPQDATNPQLMAVGATYGVYHYSPASVDRNHWSSNGH